MVPPLALLSFLPWLRPAPAGSGPAHGRTDLCATGGGADCAHGASGPGADPAQRTGIVRVAVFVSGTGTATVRTPSRYSAVASSPLAPAGSRTDRTKVP